MTQPIKKRTRLSQVDKEAAVRKYLDGKASVSDIAMQYNIGESTLYKLVKKFNNGDLHPVTEIDSNTNDKAARNFLEKKVARLEEENELLKIALATIKEINKHQIIAEAVKQGFNVNRVCKLIGISRAAYYKALKRRKNI